MDEAGKWQAPPRAQLDLRRWEVRVEELAAFVEAGSPFPSYRYAESDTKRVLGNWLHGQRQQVSQGKLSAGQLQSLRDTVPGWNARQPPLSRLSS